MRIFTVNICLKLRQRLLVHGTKSVRINETNKTCSNAVSLSLLLLSPFPTILYRWEKKKRRRRKESLSRIGQWNFSPFSSPGTGGEELLRRFLELRLESPEFSIPLLATVSTHRESNRATSYSPIFEIAALRIRRGCELFKELLIRNIIFPDYSRSYFFRNNFMQLSKLEAEYQRRII